MTTEEQKFQEQVEQEVEQTAEQANATVDEAEVNEAGEASLEAQLAAVTLQLEQAKDQALRSVAEAQNIRRRAEQDVEKAHKFALEKFSKELLPVVDSLERAVETFAQHDVADAVKDGIVMTLDLFVNTLSKFNVEQVSPMGAPFDPQQHEAMAMVPNPNAEPNTVIDVMQKGYLLNGRLVRPAMVVVSKAP